MANGDGRPGGYSNSSPGPYYYTAPSSGTSVQISGGSGGNAYGFNPNINPSGVYIGGGGTVFPQYPPLVSDPLNGLLQTTPKRPNLTAEQLAKLMDHEFVAMDPSTPSPFCLLCYALDMFRMQHEHQFVIHEE